MKLKFEYTENNHFKWGWGDEWYNVPDPEKQYKLHLGHITRPVMRFRDECIDVAKKIASKATKPICVGLSGGSDSQMACLAFREAGIQFKVVIVTLLDYNDNAVNSHDIKNAYKFCKQYDIEYIEHTIDLDNFYRGKGYEYAKKYGLDNIHTLIQCDTMDFICPDYCYIMAGGDVVFSLHDNFNFPDEPAKTPLVNLAQLVGPVWWNSGPPIMQHMITMGYEGTSKFYLYTPEIIVSYLTDQTVKDFLNAKDPIYQVFLAWFKDYKMWWRCFHLMFKPLMTQREWPEMVVTRKFTGFENLPLINNKQGIPLETEYAELISKATNGITKGQVIAPTIEELIEYVSTEHVHSLTAKRFVSLI